MYIMYTYTFFLYICCGLFRCQCISRSSELAFFFRETSICSVDPTPGLSTPKDGILNTSCQLAWGTHCVICFLFVCLFVCLFCFVLFCFVLFFCLYVCLFVSFIAPNLRNPSCSNALMVFGVHPR